MEVDEVEMVVEGGRGTERQEDGERQVKSV